MTRMSEYLVSTVKVWLPALKEWALYGVDCRVAAPWAPAPWPVAPMVRGGMWTTSVPDSDTRPVEPSSME